MQLKRQILSIIVARFQCTIESRQGTMFQQNLILQVRQLPKSRIELGLKIVHCFIHDISH